MNRIVQLKAEQIARLVVQGVSMTRIAIEMGMSYDGLLRITKTEEYLAIQQEVQDRVLGRMDAKLAQRTDLRNQMADEMEDDAVPEAWKIVLDNLRKKRDLKTALEVLDRDPKRQFAKGAANAGNANASASPGAVPRPSLDHNVLQQAIAEADITHDLLEKDKLKVKPAQA
jgi:hypothetical protein